MVSPRLHPFWRLVLAALVVLGITLVVAGIGTGILIVLGPRVGLNIATSSITQLTEKITHDYGLLLTVLAYPPALLALWLFRTNIDKRSWASLGFGRSRALPNFARGALTGFGTLALLFSLMWLAGAIRFNGLSGDVLTRGWPLAVVWLLLYLVAFFGVGFMEETTFRGYGLHNLNEWLGWKWAVGVQAGVFALVHLGNGLGNRDVLLATIGALPSLVLIAVLFAVSYRKTGSLWFAIGFHTFWNWSLGCVFSLPVSGIGTFRLFDIREGGTNFLSGGKFGAEGSFFLIPILLAMLYFLLQSPDHPRALADLRGDEEPQLAPSPAPLSSPFPAVANMVEEADEAPRVNRYGARFGSGEGFDSGMLGELRTMQEERERVERERLELQLAQQRAEDAREEELRRARLAVQTATVAPVEIVALEVAAPATIKAKAAENVSAKQETPVPITVEKRAPVAVGVAAPLVAPTQVAAQAPTAPPRPAETPQSGAPASAVPAPAEPRDAPPKKARPRW